MMHAQAVITLMTVAEYLRQEPYHSLRHEYIDGHLFAMAGGSKAHNQIAGNLVTRIRPSLRGTDCRVYMVDMKLATANCFYYPDIVVTCQLQQETADLYVTHPCFVVEVLSPSTEHIDKREKLIAYQRIPSLQTYLIIAQDQLCVEHYWREAQGEWYHDIYTEPTTISFSLAGVNLDITMNVIYEDVLSG